MENTEIRFIEGEFQRVVVNKGDVIVIHVPKPIPQQVAELIMQQARQVFGTDKVIILDSGAKLGVAQKGG